MLLLTSCRPQALSSLWSIRVIGGADDPLLHHSFQMYACPKDAHTVETQCQPGHLEHVHSQDMPKTTRTAGQPRQSGTVLLDPGSWEAWQEGWIPGSPPLLPSPDSLVLSAEGRGCGGACNPSFPNVPSPPPNPLTVFEESMARSGLKKKILPLVPPSTRCCPRHPPTG